MKRSTKSNRVTWASGLNLCQVRLFMAEDCPSKVGAQTEGHNPQNDLPPGFEGCHYLNSEKDALSCIPRILWKCPPRVVLESEWHVAAGEESQEAEVQKSREMRMLEAVFPHCAAIPPSPSVSLNVKEECYDDSLTPAVPQTPVEEAQQSPADLLSDGNCDTPPTLQLPTNTIPKLGADIIGASVDALKKTMDISSIDTEFLVKIFTDPNMIKKLMTGDFTTIIPKSNFLTSPIPTKPAPAQVEESSSFRYQTTSKLEPGFTSPVPTHEKLHHTKNKVQPALSRISPQVETFCSVSLPRPENLAELAHKPGPVQSASNVTSYKPDQAQSVSNMGAWPIMPPSSGVGVIPVQPKPGSALKRNVGNLVMDMNYIKNLIEEHGTEKKELPNSKRNHNGRLTNQIQNLECGKNVKRGVAKPKFKKHCMYFQSPKGCRNGSNCQYQHDLYHQFHSRGQLDVPVAKRMKLSGEITIGRA